MKGKPKSRFDFYKGCCEYEDAGWCNLPKFKRCGSAVSVYGNPDHGDPKSKKVAQACEVKL